MEADEREAEDQEICPARDDHLRCISSNDISSDDTLALIRHVIHGVTLSMILTFEPPKRGDDTTSMNGGHTFLPAQDYHQQAI
jgi:hypothetical protein